MGNAGARVGLKVGTTDGANDGSALHSIVFGEEKSEKTKRVYRLEYSNEEVGNMK